MKRFIPIICAAALLAGCGKTASSSSKTSDTVVKGETVENSSAESSETSSGSGEEEASEASGKTGKPKTEPATRSSSKKPARNEDGEVQIVTGPKEGNAAGGPSPRPPVTIPRPKKPVKNQSSEGNGGEESSSETADAAKIYAAVLNGMLDNGKLPVSGYPASNIDGSEFAVADVDGDGAEELVLRYTGSGGAESFIGVYGVSESGSIFSKGAFTLAAEFYTGGLVKNYASHNQGPCGDFQGFSLEKYDPSSGIYQPVFSVEALDKAAVEALAAEAAEKGEEPAYVYPEEADKSGSGRVYYIISPGSEDSPDICDVSEYEARVAQYLSGAELIAPGFKPLVRENIEQTAD